MLFMNEHDVEGALRLFNDVDTPNLYRAAESLALLVDWTNSHSDGWAYWPKPCRAAKGLQQLLQDGITAYRRGAEQDCTEADLKKALVPVRAFLTRQGADLVLR